MSSRRSFTEQPLVFPCGVDHLVGVMAQPLANKTRSTGVVIVVGGPQYRAGSHRQFVHWARAFAGAGYPCLRFDTRGMGDSTGQQRTFLEMGADIRAAIDALFHVHPELKRVVLCGLCDGASAALLYLGQASEARVKGLIMLNPWVRTEQTQARTVVKHYYWQRLRDPGFWKRLISGQVGAQSAAELLGNLKRMAVRGRPDPSTSDVPAYPSRMASTLASWTGQTLLVLSGKDYTAKEFLDGCSSDATWARAMSGQQLRRLDLPDSDHTVSNTADRTAVETASLAWICGLDGDHPLLAAASEAEVGAR